MSPPSLRLLPKPLAKAEMGSSLQKWVERKQSRDAKRSRRLREVRAHTEALRNMPRREIARVHLELLADPVDESRPITRGDCVGGERPCPFVGCKYHLFLDVNETNGSIKFNYGHGTEPEDLLESCALDVADRGGATLEELGELMNVVRERVRQLETIAIDAVRPDIERLLKGPGQ